MIDEKILQKQQHFTMRSFVSAMISASEKAALIARACRQEDDLFQMLIQVMHHLKIINLQMCYSVSCIACFLSRTNSTLPNYFCRRSTARTSTQQPIMISRRWQTYSYRYVMVELCTGVSIPLCCHLGCVCFVLLMVSPHCEQEKINTT